MRNILSWRLAAVSLTAAAGLMIQAAPPSKPSLTATLTTWDGTPERRGSLELIAKEGWTVSGGGGAVSESALAAVYLETPPAASTKPEVILANGDRFRAIIKETAQKKISVEGREELRDFVTFEASFGATVEMDLERLQAILFWQRLSGVPPEVQKTVLEKVLAETPPTGKDLVALDLGGGVDLDDSSYVGTDLLKAGTVARQIPDPDDAAATKNIEAGLLAVRLKAPAPPPGLPPGSAGPTAILTLADGGRLTGRVDGVENQTVKFATVHGFSAGIPLREIRQIDFAHEGIAFLSDLTPAKVTARRFADPEANPDGLWPHLAADYPAAPGEARRLPLTCRGRVYRKGLGMHSYARVAYAVPPGFSRFAAEVGLDDHVADEANPDAAGVVVRVWGDGKLLYESGFLTIRSAPAKVNVAIANIKTLELETDWGDRKDLEHLLTSAKPPVPLDQFLRQTDMLDRVSWGHAALVK